MFPWVSSQLCLSCGSLLCIKFFPGPRDYHYSVLQLHEFSFLLHKGHTEKATLS